MGTKRGGKSVLMLPATVASPVVQPITRVTPANPPIAKVTPAVVPPARVLSVIPAQLSAEEVEHLRAENADLRAELERVRPS